MTVCCVGNAICDLIATVELGFAELQGLTPGSMNLIDTERSRELVGMVGDTTLIAGGSAANTAAGIASFGGASAFMGRVADDDLGDIYTRSLSDLGVQFAGLKSAESERTGTSVILVEPDGQRTMNTHLGAAEQFSKSDYLAEVLNETSIIYVELYLWDRPKAQEAILEIIAKAKSNEAKFALSLSDTFCIDRHSASVFELIKDSVDILFGNEAEWQTLLALEPGTEHLDLVEQAWVTMGDRGAVVHSREQANSCHPELHSRHPELHSRHPELDSGSPVTIQIDPVETTVVDTTGAGDQFAAGVLYGLAADLTLEQAGKLGVAAASEVISHIGPRPERPYSALLG